MTRRVLVAAFGLSVLACSEESTSGSNGGNAGAAGAASDPRSIETSALLSDNGISEAIVFDVPAATRSLTVMVRGRPGSLYALASFSLSDAVDRVGIDLTKSWAPEMQTIYFDEQIGLMPGNLYQSMRLGTFTHVYPHAPGQELPAGPAVLRVVSTVPNDEVEVSIRMPPEDGSARLTLNLFAVSDTFTFSAAPAFFETARDIYQQAAIDLELGELHTLDATSFEQITDFTEPQETPESQSAALAQLGAASVSNGALNVFVVESLPLGVAGLSLGVPGPVDPASHYFGVVLEHSTNDVTLGRVLAHETAHFVGLQHVENKSVSGGVFPDPLPDTQPGQNNLMENGTLLTENQRFVLSRSALLVP